MSLEREMIMPQILYIANVRLPTEKAHGIQIMKTCEALALRGAILELVLPKRLNPIKDDIFDYYGIQKKFTIKKLPCLDLLSLAPFFKSAAYWLEAVTFAWFVSWYLQRCPAGELIYTRDLSSILFLAKKRRLIYEVHNLPRRANWLFRRLLKKADLFVAISQGLKEDLGQLGIAPEKVLVAPDAVDVEMFAIPDSSEECRKKLGLPLDKKIVVYTGHLYAWKGVYTLLDAAEILLDALFVFVGGTAPDRQAFQKKTQEKNLRNVLVLPHRPQRGIPCYLKAADAVVAPNSAKERISARYTSPLKIFEYMAAQRPIVASDVPSLREILQEDSATFFQPDDSASLARCLSDVLKNEPATWEKTRRAYAVVKERYSWEKRAAAILAFIQ